MPHSRRLPLLYIALFAATACANDRVRAADRRDAEAIARLQFPLPAQESFEADLNLLADVLAAKLTHPAPRNYTRDRVLGHELVRVLDLMAQWPCEMFHAPLARHFKSSDTLVIECAQALVGQRDDALRAVAETRRAYERDWYVGCFGGVETVAMILDEDVGVEMPFATVDTLLPPFVKWESRSTSEWHRRSNVRLCVSQLIDQSTSVRLQSWLWLAQRGIVPPSDVVLECWAQLGEPQQEHVLRIEPEHVGRSRLLELYENLAGRSSPRIREQLLVRRAELGSETARSDARRIVADLMSRDNFATAFTEEPGKSALAALTVSPQAGDIPTLIRLHHCEEQWVAAKAIRGLCALDHPDAIREVGAALVNPAKDFRDVFLPDFVEWQSANDLKFRRLWLDVLAKALRESKDIEMNYVSLIDAFECMSGREFGWNGFASGGGVDEEAAKKTAAACLRWYDETTHDVKAE